MAGSQFTLIYTINPPGNFVWQDPTLWAGIASNFYNAMPLLGKNVFSVEPNQQFLSVLYAENSEATAIRVVLITDALLTADPESCLSDLESIAADPTMIHSLNGFMVDPGSSIVFDDIRYDGWSNSPF